MRSQKTLYHFHSLSRVLLVIGIVVLANILISPLVFRFDLTQGKLYTISKSTKKIVKGLKSPVTLKVYISNPEELPEDVISIRQDVLDLVDEYQKAGGGNIIVEEINPTGNDTLSEEAYSFGIIPLQGGKMKQTEIAIRQYYAGIAVVYQDASVPIPTITDVNNLEYEITAAVNKMTRERVPSVGIVSGHDESLLDDIKEALKKQYAVNDIDTSSLVNIPASYDALVIAGPKKDFSDKEKYALDQFVMRGGKLFVFMDGVEINNDYLMATPANMSLNSLLEPYGVKVNSDVILDPYSNVLVPFQARNGNMRSTIWMAYPAYPKILENGLNKSSVITEKLPSLAFPFPSSLTISDKGNGGKILELVKTSDKSYVIDGNNAVLVPDELKTYPVTGQKERVIAALVSGKVVSAFSGKAIPKDEPESSKDASAENNFLESTDAGSIFVVSSSRFIELNALQMAPENFALFGNALDAIVEGEALVDIRSRSLANRPLIPVEERTALFISVGNILASALLSVVVGGGAYYIRRRQGKKAREIYA